MNIEYLRWPADYQMKGFLCDIPVFGSNARLYKKFRKALNDRTLDCMNIWPRDLLGSQLRCDLSDDIYTFFCWPNKLFLPNDDVGVLTWNPSMSMNDVEFWMMLHDKYGFTADCKSNYDLIDLIRMLEK